MQAKNIKIDEKNRLLVLQLDTDDKGGFLPVIPDRIYNLVYYQMPQISCVINGEYASLIKKDNNIYAVVNRFGDEIYIMMHREKQQIFYPPRKKF